MTNSAAINSSGVCIDDHPRSMRWVVLQGVVWASLSVLIFSGWFVVTRLGMRHELRVWDVIALRFGVGAVVLVPLLLVGRQKLPLRSWPQGIVLSLLWGAPFVLFVAVGLQLTSATLTSAATPTLMPIFAGVIGWMFFGDRLRVRQLCGYGLILLGLFALGYGYLAARGRLDPVGVSALVVAAATWAIYTLLFRRSSLTALQAVALICFWSAVIYVPAYVVFGLAHLDRASVQELLFQTLYQGVMMSVVASVAFNRAVGLLGSRAAAAIIALVPGTATMLALPVLGEVPSLLSVVAICVTAFGVLFAAAATASPNKVKEENP